MSFINCASAARWAGGWLAGWLGSWVGGCVFTGVQHVGWPGSSCLTLPPAHLQVVIYGERQHKAGAHWGTVRMDAAIPREVGHEAVA